MLFLLWPKDSTTDLKGQAVKIIDGDTFTLETGNQSLKIRLSEIDTPERNQPYGMEAKQLLNDLLTGQTVRVKNEGQDKYQRTLGRVYVKSPWWRLTDKDVNAELVRQGAATQPVVERRLAAVENRKIVLRRERRWRGERHALSHGAGDCMVLRRRSLGWAGASRRVRNSA